MSGRDRDRERDRRAAAAAASSRTNEYFVPKDGIDREVITADICRYLGNDALVRPGNYENPSTRQIQQGYFITAYRNLTTAMIADLKADSERWDAERRQTVPSGGQRSNAPAVEYRSSQVHQSRQYYGPTEAAPAISAGGYAPSPSGGNGAQQGVYDQGYQSSQGYAQPAAGYAPSQGYAQDNNYYVAGAHMGVMGDPESSRSGRAPVPSSGHQSGQVPRGAASQQQYGAAPSYAQRDSQNSYYPAPQGQSASVSATQYSSNPTDPYYGRAAPVTGTYDSQDVYDSRAYPDNGAYSQSPQVPSSTATAASSTRTRERERDDRDRPRHRHR